MHCERARGLRGRFVPRRIRLSRFVALWIHPGRLVTPGINTGGLVSLRVHLGRLIAAARHHVCWFVRTHRSSLRVIAIGIRASSPNRAEIRKESEKALVAAFLS